ncbi:Cysteine desulfurase [Pediococcus damnosus]|nr:Cysteine desulfurase [Pediococcus damnosus]AMV65605.1 Cysteine desulfurase [Pediococcus damnosus]
MTGGGQEKNQRSGTENLPAIAGMAKALRLLLQNEKQNVQQQQSVKETIYDHVSKFENVTMLSHRNEGFAPHILCFAIKGVRGETVVHAFEKYDIFISTTSACSSKKQVESSTLAAMKTPEDIATSAIRVSLDAENTVAEAEKFNQVFDKLYAEFAKLN